jgi:hypothetical protein
MPQIPHISIVMPPGSSNTVQMQRIDIVKKRLWPLIGLTPIDLLPFLPIFTEKKFA